MAKDANLVAVRILDCTGSGTISDTIAGLDWIASRHRLSAPAEADGGASSSSPGVVIMSLGVPSGVWTQSLASSVQSLIKQHGVSVVVASGECVSYPLERGGPKHVQSGPRSTQVPWNVK